MIPALFKRKLSLTGEEIERTALHEAGHAVCSVIYGLPVWRVEILPNAFFGKRVTGQCSPSRSRRARIPLTKWREYARIGCAGYAAERLFYKTADEETSEPDFEAVRRFHTKHGNEVSIETICDEATERSIDMSNTTDLDRARDAIRLVLKRAADPLKQDGYTGWEKYCADYATVDVSLTHKDIQRLGAALKDTPIETMDARAWTLGDLITPKQIWMIRTLARESGLDADQECPRMLQVPLEEISKQAASRLVQHFEQLKSQNDQQGKSHAQTGRAHQTISADDAGVSEFDPVGSEAAA
jgi:hypothetical protein